MGKAARLKAERRRQAARPSAGPALGPVQHVAAHEAGHAVVQWTLDLPFDYVSLDSSPPGVWPLASVRKHMGDTWLINAAGCIADLQLRGLILPDSEIQAHPREPGRTVFSRRPVRQGGRPAKPGAGRRERRRPAHDGGSHER
jgi:hypothetical protein